MLNYAQNDFQKQFDLAQGSNLVPLGVGFIESEPMEYFGLTPPASFVNDTVEADR